MSPAAVTPSTLKKAQGRSVALVISSLIAVVAGACENARLSDEAALILSDPVKRHPIGAELHWASLEVPETYGQGGLSSVAYFEVTRFVRQYRRDGRGPLEIAIPRHGAPGGVGTSRIASVQHALRKAGIPEHRVRMFERRDGVHSMLLSYERLAATAPTCGNWSEDAARRPEIGPYANFGCASQRNTANMVADPTDLVAAKPEAVRQSDSRATAYKSYAGGGGSGAAGAAPPTAAAGAGAGAPPPIGK